MWCVNGIPFSSIVTTGPHQGWLFNATIWRYKNRYVLRLSIFTSMFMYSIQKREALLYRIFRGWLRKPVCDVKFKGQGGEIKASNWSVSLSKFPIDQGLWLRHIDLSSRLRHPSDALMWRFIEFNFKESKVTCIKNYGKLLAVPYVHIKDYSECEHTLQWLGRVFNGSIWIIPPQTSDPVLVKVIGLSKGEPSQSWMMRKKNLWPEKLVFAFDNRKTNRQEMVIKKSCLNFAIEEPKDNL